MGIKTFIFIRTLALIHKKMKVFLVFLTIIFNSNLLSQTIEDKTISIGFSLSFQNYEHYKRLILDSPDSHIEYLGGFNFESGYNYKLIVKETKLETTLSYQKELF